MTWTEAADFSLWAARPWISFDSCWHAAGLIFEKYAVFLFVSLLMACMAAQKGKCTTAGHQISATEAAWLGLIAVSRQISPSHQKGSTSYAKTAEQQVNSNFTDNMYKCMSNQKQKCKGNKVHFARIPGQLRAAYSPCVTTFANHGYRVAAHSLISSQYCMWLCLWRLLRLVDKFWWDIHGSGITGVIAYCIWMSKDDLEAAHGLQISERSHHEC